MHYLKNKSIYHVLLITFLVSCTGEDGAVGPSGLNSLVSTIIEPIGTNCEFGGLKVQTGIDNNANGTLDSNEVLKTDFVCSIAGKNSLINMVTESAGTTCANGGIKVDSGIDNNNDGVLNEDEITISRFICNGVDGGFDEQIRLVIYGSENSAACSRNTLMAGDLIAFDKRKWNGVDSIVFVPRIYSEFAISNASAALYDQTNNEVILNSTLSTNNTDQQPEHLFSENIYDDLPEAEVDLQIQLSTENSGSNVCITGKSYLLLYRRN